MTAHPHNKPAALTAGQWALRATLFAVLIATTLANLW